MVYERPIEFPSLYAIISGADSIYMKNINAHQVMIDKVVKPTDESLDWANPYNPIYWAADRVRPGISLDSLQAAARSNLREEFYS